MDMKKKIRNFFTLSRKANGGFTLVELIVVIAILAILAGIAVPAYSGYIKKAEKAADMQLLGAVNSAFQAACMAEDINPKGLANAAMPIGADKTINIGGIVPADIQESFTLFFQGNEGTKFKVLTVLEYDAANGSFKAPEDAGSGGGVFTGIFNSLGASIDNAKKNFNNSGFATIGAPALLQKVDTVTGLATSLAGISNNFQNYLYGNVDAMAKAMGYEEGEASEAFWEEFDAMAAEMAAANPGMTSAEAEKVILSNYAVLHAAKVTTGKDATTLMGELQDGITVDEVKTLMTSGEAEDRNDGLSKAAMMYAMYTSYANNLPEETEEQKQAKAQALEAAKTTQGFMSQMDSAGFQAYLQNTDGQAKKDLEGYLGAMDIINQSTSTEGGKAVISDLVMNGYNSAELSTALEDLLK